MRTSWDFPGQAVIQIAISALSTRQPFATIFFELADGSALAFFDCTGGTGELATMIPGTGSITTSAL